MTMAMNRCPVSDMQCNFECEHRSKCVTEQKPDNDGPSLDLHTCERIVIMFIQLKDYLGSYWLAPWFFVYIYPSVLVYESYGFAGTFIYCNIIQVLFFVVFEFWDESFNWTPLHDTIRTYFSQILGFQNMSKSADELILFCVWVFSWAAVPAICFINGHIFELSNDRLERLTSYITLMTVIFIIAYIIILLWIDMTLLEVKSNVFNNSDNLSLFKSELLDDTIELDAIPDLETVYEDISITSEFSIDNDLHELSEEINESTIENDYCNFMKVEQGEEAKEQDIDLVSLSSSTLSDFDVITEEEINSFN